MITPVNPELAKLLKEKGFDVKDRTKYEMYGGQVIPQLEPYNDTKWNIYKDYHLAPIIAEVVMWLYEKHGIWISVQHRINGEDYVEFESNIRGKFKHSLNLHNNFNSPTEAYEAAIEYTLKNLIK